MPKANNWEEDVVDWRRLDSDTSAVAGHKHESDAGFVSPGDDDSHTSAYFITICTAKHAPLFGRMASGRMKLNHYGQIVQSCWDAIPEHAANAELDISVIMPNHIHGILWITDSTAAEDAPAAITPASARPDIQPGSLGAVIRSFKSAVTRRINQERGSPGTPVWQANYWARIILSQDSLDGIRRYIRGQRGAVGVG